MKEHNNKIDIAKPKDIENIREIYEGLYPVVMASAETGDGIDELKSKLSGKKKTYSSKNCRFAADNTRLELAAASR